MAYRRATGSVNTMDLPAATGASGVIAQGDLVMRNSTNKNVVVWTTTSALLGIAKEASTTSSSANIEVDVLRPGDAIIGAVDTGTPATTDQLLLVTGDKNGINQSSTAGKDFLAFYTGSATEMLLWPTNVELNSNP